LQEKKLNKNNEEIKKDDDDSDSELEKDFKKEK